MIDLFSQNISRNMKFFALSLAIFLSLGGLHYVSFTISIPWHLRPLLDSHYKLSFFSEFYLVALFSVLIARYLPMALLACGAHLIEFSIEVIYVRRGYVRVALAPGIFLKGRLLDNQKMKDFQKQLQKFGRREARLDNFIRRKVRNAIPIGWYERNQYWLMIDLSILFALLILVGFFWASMLFLISTISLAAYQSYFIFNDNFFFSLKGYHFRDDDENQAVEERYLPSARTIFLISLTLATIAIISGPIRMNTLTTNLDAIISHGDDTSNSSIIGTTGNGILAFDGEFRFLPYTSLIEVR